VLQFGHDHRHTPKGGVVVMDPFGPDEAATKLNAWKGDITIPAPTAVFLTAGGGHAVAQVTLKLDPALDGVSHVLAFATETAAGTAFPDGGRPVDGSWCPRTLQVSADIFRDAAPGLMTAEAAITYRGRTTRVVEVTVRDDRDRLVARVAVTQLSPSRIPGASGAAAARPAAR
jgi:acyl-coenzyme A thioesterase PaaI-like protein